MKNHCLVVECFVFWFSIIKMLFNLKIYWNIFFSNTCSRLFVSLFNMSMTILFSIALKFFRENHSLLSKAIIFEWAKFLEKINLGLPMLISKIERSERYRGSLESFKLTMLKHFDTCLYCNNTLSPEKQMIHVDHFIPRSYVFEDELWNFVLTCRKCNLKKHSSLPSEKFIYKLVERNNEFSNMIDPLKNLLSD